MSARGFVLPILVGVIGATSCGSDEPRAASTTAPATTAPVTTVPVTTAPVTTAPVTVETTGSASVLFDDSFDDDANGWGIVDDPDYGSTAYSGGDYVWDFRGSVAHWLPAVLGEQYDRGELEMRDVSVHAEVTIDDGGGVVGVFCRETADTDAEYQWYEFVVRDGFAAIRRADSEGNIEVLADNKETALPIGQPITLDATCVDVGGVAQLDFTINGTSMLHATDDQPLGNGVPGLQAWTFPIHERMDIRWHEFTIRPAGR